MLTKIILNNYTTFINETIFSFEATNYKILEDTNVGTNRVLKGALFIGENASGKTQVLKSITFLLDLLLANKEYSFLTMKSMYTSSNKFNLKYYFNVNKNIINYEIEFEGNDISSEKLFLNNELIINRIKENAIVSFSDDKREVVISQKLSILKQEYYLTKLENNEVLNDWFLYLKNSIYFNCLTGEVITYNNSRIGEQILEKYIENNNAVELNEFLDKLGYNSEIVVGKEFNNMNIKILAEENTIAIRKKETKMALPLELESLGNRVFMRTILPVIYATNNNGMLIFDEFSSGLHNELEEALIKYFFNNSQNSQLFFVSHSTNLLDTFILRPDQIYSFKFDAKKGTIIKRFSDENPRESQNMEKMYLSGVFDGKPTYNKKFKI